MAEDVFGIVGSSQAEAYDVKQVVAEGGFAVVYKAYHRSFRSPVALKCLKIPTDLSDDQQQEFLERFREEGELLFRLSASVPAVVRPLHVGTLAIDRFAPYIVLEWLEGRTLEDELVERAKQGLGPFSVSEAVRLLTPVALALDRAHHFPGPLGTLCIVHRDVKPENIFIVKGSGESTTKILDFGIGKVKSAATQIVGRQSLQRDQLTAFTPAYGAPEQWVPKRFGQTGRWTDVWGFALTLVYALTGRAPFDGDPAALMGGILDETRRPTPRQEGLEVNDSVEAVFLKALAVDPADRFGTMQSFWSALRAAAGIDTNQLAVPAPAHDRRLEGNLKSSRPPPPDPTLRRERVDTLALPRSSHRLEERRASDGDFVRAQTEAHVVPDLELPPKADPALAEKESCASRSASVRKKEALAGAQKSPDFVYDHGYQGAGSLDELPGVGLSPKALPHHPRRIARVPLQVPAVPKTRDVLSRFAVPLRWIGLGVVVMIADYIHSLLTGELFSIASVRPIWVAGPIVLLAVLSIVFRLIHHEN